MFDARCAVGESNRNALLTSVRSPLVDYRSTWWWITCLGFAGFDDGADHEGKAILIWCVSVLTMRVDHNDHSATAMTMKGYPMTETNNLGFIENLAAQIDYSDGSTVSKTVMRAEGVNIVLFSFAAGEELSEHTAAMPVIVEALEGQLEITAEGRTVTLNPGGIVHFTTRLPHAVRAVEASKMALYMITA